CYGYIVAVILKMDSGARARAREVGTERVSTRFSRSGPPDPVPDAAAHDEFEVGSGEPGQFLGEAGDAFAPGAGHPGDVGAPEHAVRSEDVEGAAEDFVGAGEGVGVGG